MAKITKREAKRLSILKWQFLYDNPDDRIGDGPDFELIEIYPFSCALCAYFGQGDQCVSRIKCEECIFNPSCSYSKSLYRKWQNAETAKTRKKYAGLILEKIKEW